jgi:GDP-L-fucose synthase
MMEFDAKIYVAGHRGMVGSSIVKRLQEPGYHNILTENKNNLNLRSQEKANNFFSKSKTGICFPDGSHSWWNKGQYGSQCRFHL